MLKVLKLAVAALALVGAGLFSPAFAQSASEMAVRMQQLEEQVRLLTGQVQELTFQVKQLRAQAGSGAAPQQSGSLQQPVQPVQPPAAQAARQPEPSQQKRLAAASEGAPIPDSNDVETIEQQPIGGVTAQPQQAAGGDGGLAAPGPKVLGTGDNSAARANDGGFQGKVLVPPSQQEPGDDAIVEQDTTPAQQPQTASDGTSIETVALAPDAAGESPESLYERSNESLLRRQFGDAEAGFSNFLQKYPDHSLAGSAQYWLGETFYAQGDFKRAASNFLQGYKKYPKSRRAPDSLLKLGISLNRLGQAEQACAAYAAVSAEYPKAVDARKRAAANPSVPAALPDLSADFSPLRRERHVALAVSGGSDSTALMRLSRDWRGIHHPELKLSVLTVDHGLREQSAGEVRQVAEWAGSLGLPHHALVWEGPKPATGIQAKAREARYGLMAGWSRNAVGLLLTAHTMDDQAETVLMRLTRTLSTNSLAGIPAHGNWDGVALFRPLLGARREALRAYLSSIGQNWAEDASNADERFERVRVRQSLVVLGNQGVTPERLAALAEAGARTSALMEKLSNRWLSLWLKEEDSGFCHVPSEPFLGLPEPLQQRILERIVRHYGGGSSSPEPEELRRLARWVAEGPVRCTLGGALLGRRKQGFWAAREAGRISPEPLIIPESGAAMWDGRFLVKAEPGTTVTAPGSGPLPLNETVPAAARRSYPVVALPAGAMQEPEIAFRRLLPL